MESKINIESTKKMLAKLAVTNLFEQWKKERKKPSCTLQMIDFNNSMWPSFLGMYATAAHSESNNISQRTKNGLAEAIRAGQYTATAPVGFIRIDTDRKTKSNKILRVLVL